ncbi:Arginine kinase [Aphelenchoides besseyi]|nr:Arginine kinase [Aphelenchoides besseyi]
MSVPQDVIQKIEDGYKKLQVTFPLQLDMIALFRKPKTATAYSNKRTKLGSTLWDVIQSGVANLDSGVGLYAPDAEAYTLFKPLFDPVIESYHGFGPNQKQPATDLGEDKLDQLVDLDPEGKYINSTRIRCGRSLQGYPFNPCLTEANYLEMESKVKNVFNNITDPELKGRGIYHNNDKTFLVWVNEEDHLRIISMQNGGNVGQVLGRLIKGVKTLQQVPFSRDDRLGWLTFCPSNLGTTVRASVHMKIPKVSARPDFKELCESLKLQPRYLISTFPLFLIILVVFMESTARVREVFTTLVTKLVWDAQNLKRSCKCTKESKSSSNWKRPLKSKKTSKFSISLQAHRFLVALLTQHGTFSN